MQQLRQVEGRLNNALLEHARAAYGETALDDAHDEFLLWDEQRIEADERDESPQSTERELIAAQIRAEEFEALFLPWFLYTWCPDTEDSYPDTDYPPLPIALHYAEARGARLDPLARAWIEAACNTPFSFFRVLDADPGRSLLLRDILRETDVTVQERTASMDLQDGTILYARVLRIDDIALVFGCAPLRIPPTWLKAILEWRDAARQDFEQARHLFAEADLLSVEEDTIRELYLDIRDHILDPPPPVIQNTDGEDLELTTLHFDLACSPQEAFDALAPLAVGIGREELAAAGTYDESGALSEIGLPWLRPSDPARAAMPSTALAQLHIRHGSLRVEVNSRERAERIQAIVAERLGERTQHARSVIQSMGALPDRPDDPARIEEMRRLNELPEVQERLRAMSAAHWASWLDEPVPALDGRTPREAARDTAGRELLEALLAEFEQHDPGAGMGPDLVALRRELGLEP